MSSVSNDLHKNYKLHLSDGWSTCGYHCIESSICSSVLPLTFYSLPSLFTSEAFIFFKVWQKILWGLFYCPFVKQYLVFWPFRGSFLTEVKVVDMDIYLACLFIETMSLTCSTVGQWHRKPSSFRSLRSNINNWALKFISNWSFMGKNNFFLLQKCTLGNSVKEAITKWHFFSWCTELT